jgi:hypothetical protein
MSLINRWRSRIETEKVKRGEKRKIEGRKKIPPPLDCCAAATHIYHHTF